MDGMLSGHAGVIGNRNIPRRKGSSLFQGISSTGKTKKEVKTNMREAIEFHLEGLRSEGDKIPVPQSSSTYIPASLTRLVSFSLI